MGDIKYYIENIFHQFSDLKIIYIAEYIVVIYCIKNWIKFFKNQTVSFWNLKFLYFTCSHWFSFVVPLAVIRCHSLSLLSLVLICCHSLSFVVTRCTTRCHLLYYSLSFVITHCHSLSLVATRCTSRLSFYKRPF